ncbi:MAG: DUF4212 domain-containing protein [Myxococcales bacterium]|nr:DUF4212 domain-containing protein [Myxococcales bacterium]
MPETPQSTPSTHGRPSQTTPDQPVEGALLPSADELRHWRANLRIVVPLLAVWLLVSFGAGILFVDTLNEYTLPFSDCPLGFWVAQQGSIYVFCLIILAYVLLMNWLERELGLAEDEH